MPYYITTPIYYVNGEPHLGHAYTTIAADVLARHMRQRGEDVFFLTGTDEHGEPVTQAAERLGITPRELGDRNAGRFKELAAKLNATNDFFIRTTDPEHGDVVAEVVQRIHDNGHVYEGTYEGWYCPRCADFKTESELEEGNRCPIHKIELELEHEDNWFFRLSTFQEPLERLYADHPDFVVPQNRYNEALSFIESGLRDLSLSRARLKWGVPVPWDRSQVIYVGTDALRFYVIREVSFGSDGEVSPEGFEKRYTTELANEYGNLASRTVAMIDRYRDGVVPDAPPNQTIAGEFEGITDAVCDRLDSLELTAALDEIWRRIKRINRYVQEEQPWQLAKDEAQAERLDEILCALAEWLRVVSVLLHPFMPESAERLLAALGREDLSLDLARFGAVPGGATIGELAQLFPRVEAEAPAA